MKLPRYALKHELEVHNVDGTPNKIGKITHYTKIIITIGRRTNWETFYLARLGQQKIILGLPWFRENNPDIDWITGQISWRSKQTNPWKNHGSTTTMNTTNPWKNTGVTTDTGPMTKTDLETDDDDDHSMVIEFIRGGL